MHTVSTFTTRVLAAANVVDNTTDRLQSAQMQDTGLEPLSVWK